MQAVVLYLRLRSQVREVLYMLQAPSCFSSFYSLLSTKRPSMLWGSTCRAVTSFRPYELVDRPGNAYICQSNAYAYRPPYRYTCRMRISADQSIERRPTVRLHRTLAPYCYHTSTTLPPTTDRAVMPAITHQTMTVLFCLQSDNDRAVTPTIYQPTDRQALCLTSIITAAGTVLPPEQTAAPACSLS